MPVWDNLSDFKALFSEMFHSCVFFLFLPTYKDAKIKAKILDRGPGKKREVLAL